MLTELWFDLSLARRQQLFKASGLLAGIASLLFYYYLAMELTVADFERFFALSAFLGPISLVANGLGLTVRELTSFYQAKGEREKQFYFFRQHWWLAWFLGAMFSLGFLLLALFSRQADRVIFFPLALVALPLFLLAFERGVLLGKASFLIPAGLLLLESLGRPALYGLFLFLPLTPLWRALLALTIPTLAAWLASLFLERSFSFFLNQAKSGGELKLSLREAILLLSLASGWFWGVDFLVVRQLFAPLAAGYGLFSLIGQSLFYLFGAWLLIFSPKLKESLGLRFFFFFLAVGGFLPLLAFLGQWLVGRGEEPVKAALTYFPPYFLSVILLIFSLLVAIFGLTKKNTFNLSVLIGFLFIEAALTVFIKPSFMILLNWVFKLRLVLLPLLIAFELLELNSKALVNNLRSFVHLFKPKGPKKTPGVDDRLKVLFFNWRDIRHSEAGGAEVYLSELTRRLVKQKMAITVFTANDGHCLAEETINKVRVVRRGGQITVYLWAMIYYLFKFRGQFDLIVDIENGIPFFTPLYCSKPIVLIVHHVHQEVFYKSLLPPFSWLALFLEGRLMPLIYRQARVVTISDSTARDLDLIGLKPEQMIYCGVDSRRFRPRPKASFPQILYLGRLKEYKGIGTLLIAFKKLTSDFPQAKLLIAGVGDFRSNLENQAKKLELKSAVQFLGYVSEKRKVRLLAESWVTVFPSYKEGWGIVCLESNACGTPVIASSVEGLKEAILPGENGFLFPYGNIDELYCQLKALILDEPGRRQLAVSARAFSLKYSWDTQALKLGGFLRSTLAEKAANRQLAVGLSGLKVRGGGSE